MAVPIAPASNGLTLEPGAPVPFFLSSSRAYMVAPDGQRFLVNAAVAGQTTTPITLMVNWPAALKP